MGRRNCVDRKPSATRRAATTATPEFVRGVDFVGVPTHDIAAAAQFYGETLGLPRSVYLEERHFSEYETGNLTLSVYDAELPVQGAGYGRCKQVRGDDPQEVRQPTEVADDRVGSAVETIV